MNKMVSSAEMIATVTEATGYPEAEVSAVIRAYAQEIQRQLNQQNAVEIEGLGYFRPAPKEEA